MSSSPNFDALRAGDRIPGLRISVDPVQQFFFSASEYLGHRIHYDHLWTTQVEGHDAILISTTLLEATMHRVLAAWAGPKAWITRLSLQNHNKVYPREELAFDATVLETRRAGAEQIVDMQLTIEKAQTVVVMSGKATVVLNRR